MARRAQLDRNDLQMLAAANALPSLAGHRREAPSHAAAAVPDSDMLPTAWPGNETPALQQPSEAEDIVGDYRSIGLTLGRHPLALLRARLKVRRLMPASTFHTYRNGRLARACDIVTVRQCPDTAKGIIFLTIEDETGGVDVINWSKVLERQRREVLGSSLLGVLGCGSARGSGNTLWRTAALVCPTCLANCHPAAGTFTELPGGASCFTTWIEDFPARHGGA